MDGGVSVFDNGIHIGVEEPRLFEIVVRTDGGVVGSVRNVTAFRTYSGGDKFALTDIDM
jgi:hypothetical protein